MRMRRIACKGLVLLEKQKLWFSGTPLKSIP